MKKYSYLIVIALISSLVLTGCLLSNVGQVPTTEQSGITYLTKNGLFSDIVGLWHFDEGSEATTIADSSGYGNDGIVNGATTGVLGNFGNALSFDGVNNYVEVPKSTSLNPNHITVEAWFNAVAGTLTTQKTLVQKPFTSHVAPHYQYTLLLLDTAANPKLAAFSITVGGVSHWAIAKDLSYGYGTWHHLAGTYDGLTITLYFDGTPVASKSVSGTISTYDTVIQIGAYPNLSKTSTYCFKGIIDEVRIWNFALSQDQLGKVYEFNGFFPPVDNNALNAVKAGSAIPVKFSLKGDQGLDIFVPGYPKSIPIKCDEEDLTGEIAETMTAGGSILSYDALEDQYIYIWKTDKAWAGTCRKLVVKLFDGTSHEANFKFK